MKRLTTAVLATAVVAVAVAGIAVSSLTAAFTTEARSDFAPLPAKRTPSPIGCSGLLATLRPPPTNSSARNRPINELATAQQQVATTTCRGPLAPN